MFVLQSLFFALTNYINPANDTIFIHLVIIERERGCIFYSHVAIKWHSRVQQKLTGYNWDKTKVVLSHLHWVICVCKVQLNFLIYLYVHWLLCTFQFFLGSYYVLCCLVETNVLFEVTLYIYYQNSIITSFF